MEVKRIKCLPRQMQFIRSRAREVMYSGAVRAGKTYCLALKVAMRASVPHSREILCRKTLVALKATTLRTLLEGDGITPPILEHDSYVHEVSKQTIKLNAGGEIVYFGIDNPARIGSYSGTGAAADEAVELTESDYRMLGSRASVKVPDLDIQINLACNPDSPSHHLAKRFGIAPETTAVPGTEVIHTRTRDNKHLEPEYIAWLDNLQGTLWHRRFVEGKWCGNEGTVYDLWDRNRHVQKRNGPWARVLVGVDDGYTNPFAAVVVCVDGDGRAHVASEHYERRLLAGRKADIVAELGRAAEAVLYDPSAADLGAEFLSRDLPAIPAVHEKRPGENETTVLAAGIAQVQRRLALAGDGLPRLTVDPSCTNVIAEFETYEWERDRSNQVLKDKPRKASDHAMDGIRYVIRHIDGKEVPYVASFDSARVPAHTMEPEESLRDLYRRLRHEDEDFGFVANGQRH